MFLYTISDTCADRKSLSIGLNKKDCRSSLFYLAELRSTSLAFTQSADANFANNALLPTVA